MRNLFIGFIVIIAAIVIYGIVARRALQVSEARQKYFTACDKFDITHPEGEHFLEFLDQSLPGAQKKRNEIYYVAATNELRRRITVPRSVSRDRRPIESIIPR